MAVVLDALSQRPLQKIRRGALTYIRPRCCANGSDESLAKLVEFAVLPGNRRD